MTTTFTQTKATLDEIAARSEQNRKLMVQAKALIAQAVSDLGAMPATYMAFITDLDAAAVANPTDGAWQTAKAEKDQMVTDFQALKAAADALAVKAQ